MLKSLVTVSVFSIVMVPLSCGVAYGQNYPSKPIRILTSAVGGGQDILSRLLAQGISGPLGQTVIVENRTSRLLGQLGVKAAPDGYTVLTAASTFILGPLLEKVEYDPVKDFAPITTATSAANVLIVHPSLPVKSVKDLIALAKTRPGELNYASGGTGSSAHLAGELLMSLANVKFQRIDYKGTAMAQTDLISGQVHMMIAAPGAVVPHIQAGRLRALGVTSAGPSKLFPGLTPVAATLPGYEITAKTGIMAPAGTPPAIINRLNQEIARVLNREDIREKLLNLGMEAVNSTPEEFAGQIKSDLAKVGKIVKDAGIQVQ